MHVRPGIEVLLDKRKNLIRGARIGIVVHPASILPDFQHTVDALFAGNEAHLVSLFGPQHGARGEKQDNMIESEFYCDPDTGLPVHSLYGKTRHPTEDMMKDIDLLIFDLQDAGTRVYTFISTMAYCMEACATYGKQMIVLDRPNPINGRQVEGNLLKADYRSFVGLFPIPMRHGMTTGELALLFNSEFGLRCSLTVVPMEGWDGTNGLTRPGFHGCSLPQTCRRPIRQLFIREWFLLRGHVFRRAGGQRDLSSWSGRRSSTAASMLNR